MAKRQYIVVSWEDAHGNPNDVDENDIDHKPMLYHSPGWLLRSDEIGVSIALEWCESDGTFRGHTFVPRKMVLRETALASPTRAKRRRAAETPTQNHVDRKGVRGRAPEVGGVPGQESSTPG